MTGKWRIPALSRWPRIALAAPVHVYRLVISPMLPPRCRFVPTCSAYALEAIESHGALRGSWLAMRRVLRCHPVRWLGGSSGHDPVPATKARKRDARRSSA
jgi:putative membrane protein insertion efficiency factor